MTQSSMTRNLFVVTIIAWLGVAGTTEASPANILTAEETNDGFHLLFDGNTLMGWHGYGDGDMVDRWIARNGVLAINPASDKHSDLITDDEYENFELRIDWSISAGGNSGIMFNVVETPELNKPWHTGPEIQILDDENHKDSSDGHRTGDLYDLVPRKEDMGNPAGEWNETRLLVEDGLVRHWLNGSVTFEVQLGSPEWDKLVAKSKFKSKPGFGTYRRGHIVLQDHGDVVRFRNIRIREF